MKLFSLPIIACFSLLLLCNSFVHLDSLGVSKKFKSTSINVFGKNKKNDLSSIESRDMTKEEMLELNKKNEDIMNMELTMMTGFSLVISLPILYLCWVAFNSD